VSPAKVKEASPKPKDTIKTEASLVQITKPSPKKSIYYFNYCLIIVSASPVKPKEEGAEEEVSEETTTSKVDAKANFRKWQNRAPPPLLGQKERPVGKLNCLQGLDFLLTGLTTL
jgi:hypothetical protein